MVGMPTDAPSLTRRSPRTRIGRRADVLRRAIGHQIAQMRTDAGVSQHRLAAESGIAQSFLSKVERGHVEPSIAVLVAIGEALGADLSLRLYPSTGPRIRDRLQAPILEALLRELHPSWKRLVEVPVWRPVRGVIDAVVARPGDVVIATEIHSEVRRLEQQLRWAVAKADALPSAEAWSMLSGGRGEAPVSRLLVLRNTRTNRELARTFEATLQAAYPARVADAVASLRTPGLLWPGAALIWAGVSDGVAELLDRPPRGVRLGR
jgi:transcriptional regulator with XRE-family HTH domain